MKKIVVCIICILIVLIFASLYRASKLSTEFDNLKKDDINKLGIIDNNGIEYLFYDGTIEFETVRNKLFDLLNELHEIAPALKRGESKKAGIMIVYNKDMLFKIYFGYSPISNIIRLEIHSRRNFVIEKNFYINPKASEDFFSIFTTQIEVSGYSTKGPK
jgi:hypothetical protein